MSSIDVLEWEIVLISAGMCQWVQMVHNGGLLCGNGYRMWDTLVLERDKMCMLRRV